MKAGMMRETKTAKWPMLGISCGGCGTSGAKTGAAKAGSCNCARGSCGAGHEIICVVLVSGSAHSEDRSDGGSADGAAGDSGDNSAGVESDSDAGAADPLGADSLRFGWFDSGSF